MTLQMPPTTLPLVAASKSSYFSGAAVPFEPKPPPETEIVLPWLNVPVTLETASPGAASGPRACVHNPTTTAPARATKRPRVHSQPHQIDGSWHRRLCKNNSKAEELLERRCLDPTITSVFAAVYQITMNVPGVVIA